MTDGSLAPGVDYPPRFLERYEPLECLSPAGETLLVLGREDEVCYIAKVTRGESGTEASLLENLSHPGLPRYVEGFSQDGVAVSVRAYVPGQTLEEALGARPLSQAQIVDIGVQLCDVLTYLHSRTPPIIHRDIKPQNVILTETGRVVLIDFGIARRYKPDARRDTVFSGTNDFAPPEQYGFAQTDARADIYSLGRLLRCLLTGGQPDDPVPDRPLRRVLARCTAFAPDRRYSSAAQVRRALLRSHSKTPLRCAVAAAVLGALVLGFVLGRCLPERVDGSVQAQAYSAAQTEEEYARAQALGFVPALTGEEDPDSAAVSWSAFCGMLGAMVEQVDPALVDHWQTMTAAAPDTPMHRDGGMVSLLFAGELLGIDQFNATAPACFSAYAPRVWETATMDYPVFQWNRYKRLDAGCYDNNYVGPAYDYAVRRVSPVSGRSLLEFDGQGDLRLEQPFTVREAALSVLRLYESVNPT